jgi:hypothetical protein
MKKTNKIHPLTAFRNANDNRKATVMKSLKKAQAGIQTNGDPEDMMINKPGSTGGYKKPSNPIIPPAGTRPAYDDYPNPRDIQSQVARQTADMLSSAYKQKRGGSIKSKKK